MKALLFSLIMIFSAVQVKSQIESIQMENAIVLGESVVASPDSGTVQWNGTNFQGFDGNNWIDLDASSSFNPELPSSFVVSSVVTMDSVEMYTVPDNFNLIITDLRSSGTSTIEKGGITGTFNGFSNFLGQHISLILGENMILENTNKFSFNGFLSPVDEDFIVDNLPYTVPAGKTLYITTAKFGFSPAPNIDGAQRAPGRRRAGDTER